MREELDWLIFKWRILWALILIPCAMIVLSAGNPRIEFVTVIMLAYSAFAPVCLIQNPAKMKTLLAMPVDKREVADMLFFSSVFLIPAAVFLLIFLRLSFYVSQAGARSALISIGLIPLAGWATAAYSFMITLKAWKANRRARFLSRIAGPIGIIAAISMYTFTKSLNLGLVSFLLFGVPLAYLIWRDAPLWLVPDRSGNRGIEGNTFQFGFSSPLINAVPMGMYYAVFSCAGGFLCKALFRDFDIYINTSKGREINYSDIIWVLYFFGLQYLFYNAAAWLKHLRVFRLLPMSSLRLTLYMSGISAGALSGFFLPFALIAWVCGLPHASQVMAEILLFLIPASILFACLWLSWKSASITRWTLLLTLIIGSAFICGGVTVVVYGLHPTLSFRFMIYLSLLIASFLWLWRILSHSSAPYRSS